ncbi:redoxin domain-containing protein [Litorilituus sediminis]|uniref:Redoxin domain-containing protein n=1 Tax=Litorilituus sediminis TaxID=718192 RepID=A0A4P6P4V9_9GAMM|nr:redoxin domain-containing protein [Litorilituus sediminis]
MVKIIIAFILTIALTACQLNGDMTKTQYQVFVNQGDSLPLTKIQTIDGDTINLQNQNKRKLIVLFATWCSDSNRLLRALNTSDFVVDNDIEVVAIAREEDAETVALWRDINEINVPLAIDPNREIYQRFASAGIPRLIMVTKDNRIASMVLAEGYKQLDYIQW